MYRLENEFLVACFDGQGRLTWLENKLADHGNVIDSPAADSFKLVFQQGENWENVIFGHAQSYQVVPSDTQITWILDGVRTVDRTVAITVTLQARLAGEDLVFAATVDNREDALITDFVYPQVGVIKSLAGGKPALLWPHECGQMVRNIGELLSEQTDVREEASALTLTYPGLASMQWLSLVDSGQTLYLGGHDHLFHVTELRASGSQIDRGAITLTLDRFAFVKAGETWSLPETVLKLYSGSWHHGADDYVRWAATWRPYHQKPQWIQNMLGYFLVINKQQYGDNLWPYDTLPELYERAVACGCDTLGLFGWYESGHDNQYPDLTASETLGGAEALRANIQKVQAAGGHVTLYFQGHLIDILSDFYKNGGHRLEAKSRWLAPYYDQYNKFHQSAYLKHFTRKTFAIACPSCPEWRDLMCAKMDDLIAFGPNGVLYDQLGGKPPFPCFDENHPHVQGKPSLSMSLGRQKLLDELQHKTKAVSPELGFIVEHITDLYSAYVDCLHGASRPDQPGVRSACMLSPERAAVIDFPEMFRYCFPDVIITIRNARPYQTPQMTNYALTLGFRFEVELRYLADREDIRADTWTEWNRYAAAVSELRKRYWPILGSGIFIDEQRIQNTNPALITKAYTQGNHLAVAVWNDTATTQPLGLQVHGYCLKEWATIAGTHEQMPGQIDAQQVGLAIFEKETNDHVPTEE